MTQRRGLLLIISSPSGAGKSTISRRLRAWDPTIRFSVSATTRAPREGEVDGQHYYFVSVEDFQRQFETNIFGVLRTVHATREALIASRGTIAIMGSVMSFVALPVGAPYSMSRK